MFALFTFREQEQASHSDHPVPNVFLFGGSFVLLTIASLVPLQV